MKRIFRTSPPILPPPSPDTVTHHPMYLETREVPKIDGSQGAFIGVVVALSVLIVVCCAAVFYLLRHHEPTDQERSARRERFHRTREQTLHSSSTFSVSGEPSESTFGSLGDKVKRVWQSTTGTRRGRRQGGGRGWIRAGSDDEWAIHSDRQGGMTADLNSHPNPHPHPHPHPGLDVEGGDHLGSLPTLGQVSRRGTGTSTGDGVRVVESPLSDSASGFVHGQYAYTYTDPFAKTASDGALQRSQSPLSSSSSPVSSPRESESVDEDREAHSFPNPHSLAHSPRDDRRQRSAMSNGSVWTQAGSKFVEDI